MGIVMKVLHVAETIKGGVATVINELANKQLSDAYFDDVRVLAPDSQVEELIIDGEGVVLTFRRTGRNVFSFYHLAKKFLSTVINFKPDVIHLHSTFAGLICRVVLALIPFIRAEVVYCPHAFSFMMSSSSFKRKVYAFVERVLQYKTKSIICVSHNEYDEAIKYGIKKSKLTVIYNGISKPERNFGSDTNEIKKTNERFTVLFVGRFDYQKGYDILCEVIKIFSNVDVDIQFILVGGYVSEAKENIFPASSSVKFMGWLPKNEVFSIYNKADLLVIPSRWEGFAMVPIEAFRESLPVLASDFPSFGEIIRDGDTGFIFKNGSVESLYKKIMEIYLLPNRDALLSKIRSNALNDYYEHFTADLMAEKTRLVYAGEKITEKFSVKQQ